MVANLVAESFIQQPLRIIIFVSKVYGNSDQEILWEWDISIIKITLENIKLTVKQPTKNNSEWRIITVNKAFKQELEMKLRC